MGERIKDCYIPCKLLNSKHADVCGTGDKVLHNWTSRYPQTEWAGEEGYKGHLRQVFQVPPTQHSLHGHMASNCPHLRILT